MDLKSAKLIHEFTSFHQPLDIRHCSMQITQISDNFFTTLIKQQVWDDANTYWPFTNHLNLLCIAHALYVLEYGGLSNEVIHQKIKEPVLLTNFLSLNFYCVLR